MRVILSNLYQYSPFDHGMKFDEIIDRNTKVEIIIMSVSLAFVSINKHNCSFIRPIITKRISIDIGFLNI